LNEKWHTQACSIDVKYYSKSAQIAGKHPREHSTPKWRFQLLTVAPEMSWIPFELFNVDRPGSDNSEEDTPADYPRTVAKSLMAPETMQIAKGWIETCLADHPTCERPDKSQLPTRVIDVGYSDGTPTPRLQVNRGQLGRYVVLSHTWGVGNRMTLKKNNLSSFQQVIPFKRLSRTFSDAIQLTSK
jgi:hypothetical protein